MDDRTFVVVGAGLCGATAVATLRSEGFDGRIVLIGAEESAPYERPPLSKEYLRGEDPFERIVVRPPEWYAEQDIQMRLGTIVTQLDVSGRAVVLAGGERVPFDSLLVATGGQNRRIAAPGSELPGVFDLRDVGDADRLREAVAGGARVVCVGMGFIGAEVAASLRTMGCEVTVIEIFETALYRVLGGEIGRVLEGIHRDHGVSMVFNDLVARFEGDGRLERIVTKGGRTVEADVAVVGIGTEPAVHLMAGTGLDEPGGIPVGPTMETRIPGVFAAGDVARHDHPVFGPIRVEHFDNALKMGETVARNMLGAGRGLRRPALVLVGSVRREYPDGRVRTDVGSDGGQGLARRIAPSARSSWMPRACCDRACRSSWPRDVRRSFELIRRQIASGPGRVGGSGRRPPHIGSA